MLQMYCNESGFNIQILADFIPISQIFVSLQAYGLSFAFAEPSGTELLATYETLVMKKILNVDNPNVYAEYVGAQVLHPHLALISYDEVSPFRSSLNNYGIYGLFIQRNFPKYLSYGTKSIVVGDYSIIAVAPGQIGGAEDKGIPQYINGWALLWSSELYNKEYPFFSYFHTDWLRMSPSEYERIRDFQCIRAEPANE